MSFNVLPFGSRSVAQEGPLAAPDGAPAEVVDLAARRVADIPEIPDHVMEEVEAAAQLWHALRASNREVRFDTSAVTGRVVATLRDLEGSVVRSIPLRQPFGIDDGPQPAA
jgi:hypothetical protein